MEEAIQKTKAADFFFERIPLPKVEKVYSRRRIPETSDMENTKYVPSHLRGGKSNLEMQRIKEGKCKCCGKKWILKY